MATHLRNSRRSAFSHAGGNLGTTGSVSFQFERKGQVVVSKQIVDPNDKKENLMANGAAGDEEEFMMAVAEAGGDDYEDAGDEWVVWTAAGDLMAVSKGIEAQGIEVKGAELTMVPTTPTAVSGADAKKVQRLIDRLEDLDDVQDVYSTRTASGMRVIKINLRVIAWAGGTLAALIIVILLGRKIMKDYSIRFDFITKWRKRADRNSFSSKNRKRYKSRKRWKNNFFKKFK